MAVNGSVAQIALALIGWLGILVLLAIPAIQHLMRGRATRNALRDLETELASTSLRLKRAKEDGRYPPNFELPAHEWHQHKGALSTRGLSRLRSRLGAVYVKTDHLFRLVSQRSQEGDAVAVSPEDDIDEVLAQVLGALEDIRRKLNRPPDRLALLGPRRLP